MVEKLIGLISQQVDRNESAPAESEEILFDTELNGVRYILIRARARHQNPQVLLSPREKEIVRMVAAGYPNKIIASVLNISSWTVCTHLRRIFAKLGVGSRAAMVARLFEQGTGLADGSSHEFTKPATEQPPLPGTSYSASAAARLRRPLVKPLW